MPHLNNVQYSVRCVKFQPDPTPYHSHLQMHPSDTSGRKGFGAAHIAVQDIEAALFRTEQTFYCKMANTKTSQYSAFSISIHSNVQNKHASLRLSVSFTASQLLAKALVVCWSNQNPWFQQYHATACTLKCAFHGPRCLVCQCCLV